MRTLKIPKIDFIIPLCTTACPAGVDVPRYIRAVKQERYDDAVAVLREKLPLPTVCADACFAPCEDACAYKQIGEPVSIRALKRAAVDNGGDTWLQNKRKDKPTGKKVAVVGAGPAGLTAAYYLASVGHAVTMYDAWPEPGGTLRYGVPQFRLPKDRLQQDIKYILNLGVTFKGDTAIGKDITFGELKENNDAVLVACGTMANAEMQLEDGEKEGVIWGWDFLKAVSQGKEYELGSRVVVIGGGNVAVDAARTARRLGAGQVSLVYRRTRTEMPAHPDDVAAAEEEGIEIMTNWAPNQVLCDEEVTGLGLIKCASEDDGGRECKLVIDENITHCVEADTIIKAIGQQADVSFLEGDSATLKVDAENLQIDSQGVFASGDVVTGPASIVSAIGQGRKAAESIDKYLGGSGDVSETLAPPEDEVELDQLEGAVMARQKMPSIPAWKRVTGFDQVDAGLLKNQIALEANRCFQCDARGFEVLLEKENCKECGYCIEACGLGVFGPADSFNTKGYRPMETKNSEYCVGCLKCYFACPDFAIDIKNAAARG
jgi:NADPH-dependent glutamate synthase beta subunit-like oxidoreductase/NAD-dependent dihydropyrimidine dehydrogenase PreA subunit